MNQAEALFAKGWTGDQLDRRVRLWELYADGLGISPAVRQVAEETGTHERNVWKDWSAVREALAEMAAPKLEEIRSRIAGRYERVTTLAAQQIAKDVASGRHVNPQLLLRIETSQDRLAELYGATSRNMIIAPAAPKDDLADLSTDELHELAERERALLQQSAGGE